MHSLIRLIVTGDSTQAAIEEARKQFCTTLVEGSEEEGYLGPYDEARLIDDGLVVENSIHADEIETTVCYRATSNEGRKEIESAWEETRTQFTERLSEIRAEIHNAEVGAVMNDEDIRYQMEEMAAEPPNTMHHLYDSTKYHDRHIWPISTPDRYQDLLGNLEGKWVVPLDAHY